MKRWIVSICVFLLALALTACALSGTSDFNPNIDPAFDVDTVPSLDVFSVLDRETGMIFSLGDHRSTFDEALGEGEERSFPSGWHPELSHYAYAARSLGVYFSPDDIAIWIIATSNRFAFAEASFAMSQDELIEAFGDEASDSRETSFRRFYQSNGDIFISSSGALPRYSLSIRTNGRWVYQISLDSGAVARYNLLYRHDFILE